jgi:nucleotide-binding universal stress UspA family protein
MKARTILVAVDFSECSLNALEHAISIAQKAEANITMVWVAKSEAEGRLTDVDGHSQIKDAEKLFEELIKKYSWRLKNNKIGYKIRYGKIYREIIAEAQESHAWLMVTGTHGTSGFEEFWIGSNAFRLVTAAPCPIITIREGIPIKRTLRNVIMPIDSTTESRQKVPMTAAIAKIFNARVHILGLYTTQILAVRDKVDRYLDQIAKYLDEQDIRYVRVALEADNITEATLNYAKEVDANLISIMTEQEKTTANLWLGAFAQQMVNHSPYPVLSIQPKEIVRTTF